MSSTQTNTDASLKLGQWLTEQGLAGVAQTELLDGYCVQLCDLGIPLMRFHAAQSLNHPNYNGSGYSWVRDGTALQENYEHTDAPPDQWLQSPLYTLMHSGGGELRERLVDSNAPSRFPILNDLHQSGATDYFAAGVAFDIGREQLTKLNTPAANGVLMSWASDSPNGFDDAHLDLLRQTLPNLGLALKAHGNRQMAQDLLGVYLGRDAGRRVLSGEIRRGSLQEIDAVIWNFDLQGFTSLAERISGPDMISLLNDYLAVAVDVIQDGGGNILKFMGDGLLAIFDVGEIDEDTRAALASIEVLEQRMAEKTAERAAAGLAVTDFTLALHAGEILYGNIGGESRLDFTVIGPVVNQTARISGMHRGLEQRIILSEEVYRAAQPTDYNLISLGRYMLRGVAEPKELYTFRSV